jgi:hypothetical protein
MSCFKYYLVCLETVNQEDAHLFTKEKLYKNDAKEYDCVEISRDCFQMFRKDLMSSQYIYHGYKCYIAISGEFPYC